MLDAFPTVLDSVTAVLDVFCAVLDSFGVVLDSPPHVLSVLGAVLDSFPAALDSRCVVLDACGAVLDSFPPVLDSFGVVLDSFGAVLDCAGFCVVLDPPNAKPDISRATSYPSQAASTNIGIAQGASHPSKCHASHSSGFKPSLILQAQTSS